MNKIRNDEMRGQHRSWLLNVNCLILSLSPANVRQQTRVLGRLCAQVFGLGHVKQDVHDVGGDVQGQGQPAPSVPFAAVAEHLPPELRPPHEAVVCGSSSPFLPTGLGGGGEVLRGLQDGRPVVRWGVTGHVVVSPEPDCHVVVAEEREAVVGEVQTQAGGRCAQDREQQQGLQERRHAASSMRNIQSNINLCMSMRRFTLKCGGEAMQCSVAHTDFNLNSRS